MGDETHFGSRKVVFQNDIAGEAGSCHSTRAPLTEAHAVAPAVAFRDQEVAHTAEGEARATTRPLVLSRRMVMDGSEAACQRIVQ